MHTHSPAEPLTLATVLIVESDAAAAEAVAQALDDEPYQIIIVPSVAGALQVLTRQTVDVVLARQQLEGVSDGELLGLLGHRQPSAIRILLASDTESNAAARAVRAGRAHHYLRLPCEEGALALTLYNSLVQRSFLPPESEGILPIPTPSAAPMSSRAPTAG
jgi:DNA-binding NtrC family response regulator